MLFSKYVCQGRITVSVRMVICVGLYGEVVREPVANRTVGETRTTRTSGLKTRGVVDKLVACTHYSFSSVTP